MIYNNYNFYLPKPSLVDTFSTFEQAISKIEISDRQMIYKALSIASIAHIDQIRADNSPYIIHPIRVALITLEYLSTDIDSTIICAALLHDVVEDSEFTIENIKLYLNEDIANLTEKLTRYRPINELPEERKIGKYKAWEKIMETSYDARFIKCCDYLDNMISWGFIDTSSIFHNKLPRWLNEANEYYLPLAKTVNEDIYENMKNIYNIYIQKGYGPSKNSIV